MNPFDLESTKRGEPIITSADLDLATEIWAAAQRVPGEGIEDCENRIAAILADSRQARGEPIGEVLAFPMDGKPQTHSTLAGLENPQPIGMLVYAASQPAEPAREKAAQQTTQKP